MTGERHETVRAIAAQLDRLLSNGHADAIATWKGLVARAPANGELETEGDAATVQLLVDSKVIRQRGNIIRLRGWPAVKSLLGEEA